MISVQDKSIKFMSQMIDLNVMLSCGDARLSIAVIVIAPMGKALLFYSSVQTRLMAVSYTHLTLPTKLEV